MATKNAIEVTKLSCPRSGSSRTACPVAASHTQTVPRQLPDTMRLPFAENATVRAGFQAFAADLIADAAARSDADAHPALVQARDHAERVVARLAARGPRTC